MDEKTLAKVIALLQKRGVDEEVIAEVDALKDETPDDAELEPSEPADEPTPEEPVVEGEGDVPPAEPEPEPVEDVAPEGDLPPAEDDLPPAEPEAPVEPAESEPALPEGVEEVNPMDAPAEEPVAEPEPVESPVDYESKIEEQAKVIEGLKARIGSLEEALRKGGIMTDESPKGEGVGVDDPTRVSDSRDDDEVFDDLLENINRRH